MQAPLTASSLQRWPSETLAEFIMKKSASIRAALALTQIQGAWARALAPRQRVRCSYATAANTGDTCQSLSADWGLPVQAFESLNPGVSCPNLVAGQSYCVVGTVSSSSPPSTTSAAPKPTTTTSTLPTSTSPASTPKTTTTTTTTTAVASHQPQQTGTTSSCNQFYLVQPGHSCNTIASQFDITAAEFLAWNPSINSGT